MNRGVIVVDEQGRTNVEGVFAAGDCIGKVMLAHTAYREAEVAINTILGKKDKMRYNANPLGHLHPPRSRQRRPHRGRRQGAGHRL